MPELFVSEFDNMKQLAGELAANLLVRLARDKDLLDFGEKAHAKIDAFEREYPFIRVLLPYGRHRQHQLLCHHRPHVQGNQEALPCGSDFYTQ